MAWWKFEGEYDLKIEKKDYRKNIVPLLIESYVRPWVQIIQLYVYAAIKIYYLKLVYV